MFRAAFPSATDSDERRETNWVKEQYDISGFNGSTREHSVVRLAGTWVSPEDALALAESYSLSDVVKVISKASPDPTANYRRSGKEKNTPTSPTSPITSPKRRRESSPSANVQPTPPASLTVPRKSARVKSKSPTPNRAPSTKRPGRPPKGKVGAAEPDRDEETETVESMNDEMRKEDVAEQKELISDLKAKIAGEMEESNSMQQKRGREESEQEYPGQLNIKEPETSERTIATNKRVSRFYLAPREKSFAWGVAAFAVGLGAVYVPLCPGVWSF
jgi:hypothetical protein